MNARPLICFCFLYVLTAHVFAQMRSGNNVIINEPVNDDLYVAGGTVTINAPIRGDLVVAGGTIVVNDTVTQDILIAGGNITLNAFVGDDIRCAGGTISLLNSVRGDFVVAGGSIHLADESIVSGNLLSGGGEVVADGLILGNVMSASGSFILNGKAEKDITCRGGQITINGPISGNSTLAANTIALGSEAMFRGDVRYWNDQGTLDFQNSLKGGRATFDHSLELQNGKWHYLGFASVLMVIWYLGTALVMITLIEVLFRSTFRNAATNIRSAFLKSLGVGFLFLVAVPLAIVVLLITIVGVPLAVLLFVLYLTVVLMATVIVSVLTANWINNFYYQSSWRTIKIVFVSFLVFICLKLASLTPVVGPLVMLLLACIGFGGILQTIRWKRNDALALT